MSSESGKHLLSSMFNVQDTRWVSAPSSSPPSSPTACNDSSPASSPGPDMDDSIQNGDFGGESSRGSPPVHPFAASAKGSWIPPEYEKGAKKNRRMSPSSPSHNRSKKRRLDAEASLETVVAVPTRIFSPKTGDDDEAATWDAASSKMFDLGNGAIQLNNCNLSTIPKKFVEDLHRFYVAPEKVESLNATRQILPFAPPPPPRDFNRAMTAPAILGSGLPFSSRVPDRAVGYAREDIQLYLAGNQISRVPVQLLSLDKLTVLSLRSNKLTTLPPEVRHLKNLHTLNVSNNQLQYLPAEIFNMKLEVLNVFPNPFKEEPSPAFIRAKSQRRVAVSSPSRNSQRVPALVELTLRSLFSTDSGNTTNHAERRIERYYELPLCEADVASSGSGKKEFRQVIPPHLRNVLDAIHPGSVDADTSLEPGADDRPSLGLCPAAHHRKASVFVIPAEERYTWETVVASVDVGGRVPLKWRGCLWGCLDFLGIGIEPQTPHVDTTEMDVDGEQEVVTRLQFDSSNGFNMADFEDDG